MTKDAMQKHERYIRENYTVFQLHVSRETDADMIEWLDAQKSRAEYIRNLIREDIGKRRSESDGENRKD